MAICEYCNKEMMEVDSCVKLPIKHNGAEYDPIKYGDDDVLGDGAKDVLTVALPWVDIITWDVVMRCVLYVKGN